MLFVDKEAYDILKEHFGHKIVITNYEEIGEVAVECEDCYTVLLTYWEEEEE